MIDGIGHEQIIYFGFSKDMLGKLGSSLPEASVLVVEEPDVIRKRDLRSPVPSLPLVSRIVECEYLVPSALDRMLAEDEYFTRAAAVVPGGEYAVEATACAAAHFGLPGAGVRAGAVFRDKFALRTLAAEVGIRNPEHACVAGAEEARAFFERVGRPCVLKPTRRQASAGVQFITRSEQLADGWAWSADPDEGPRLPDRGIPSRVLIEEAVDGQEYSVEMLYAHGKPCFANITRKQVHPGRFPVEVGHVVPASLAEPLASCLVASTERLAAAAGFGAGALHCEWIVADHGEPVLVECAARLPGDEIVTLISLAYGFPMVEAYLRTLLGETPSLPVQAQEAAAIRFLLSPPGRVTAVQGVEAADRMHGVESVHVSAAIGKMVSPLRSSWDRAGYVLSRAEQADIALSIAEGGAGMIVFSTLPG